MRIVIHRTYQSNVIATADTIVTTPMEYIAFLRKFNVEIDMKDAVADIVAGEQIDLTLPIEMDCNVNT